jgi:SsrA-binding protein
MKILDKNKKAYFDFLIEEKFEAGIVLIGTEVKSVRGGNVTLKDSFCFVQGNEIYLKNCFIAPYLKGSVWNEDPRRDRKLLLKKREIARLIGKIKTKGYTLVPLMIYLDKHLVKVEIGLGRGKKLHDKRETLREKDIQRDMERSIKDYK